ncbi:MAG TPA: translation initiation factor IF-2 subunit alpha [Candidatus Bathyarchaeota archaeon]|nr:MAG: translation initiation factor IF-2 subunit alpha [Candidatus Bathyarchaeota archaeon]HDI07498.1 translation initiation factor IF-2 subunit alpha [Candidatus Bathyarchaeota archaeon]
MSVVKKPEWPEPGDLVIGTVKKVTEYGAYVMLDEYGKEGLLHRSEVSSSWIRNIRNFVREGQKLVLKVLRVDPEKRHIDLSLRRVTKRERIEKILIWKQERKAEGLLKTTAEKLGIPPEEVYEKAGAVLEKEFGTVYSGLQKLAREDETMLLKIGVPKKIAAVLTELAKEKIRVPMVKIKGIFELECKKPDGVNQIRDALLTAKKAEAPDAKIRLYTVAAPKYCIEVQAEDYKTAEAILRKAVDNVLKTITKAGGQGSFKREK